jgi:hypothetical protein
MVHDHLAKGRNAAGRRFLLLMATGTVVSSDLSLIQL